MSGDQETSSFAMIEATLKRIEERLSTVCSDVEILKSSRLRVAEPPFGSNSGVVQSTPAQSAVFMPPNSSGVGDDKVITGLSWAKRMDLEDESGEDLADNSTGDQSRSDKVHLTQIQDSMKEGLRKAFNPMKNAERRQLRQQSIVPDAAFIMPLGWTRLWRQSAQRAQYLLTTSYHKSRRSLWMLLDP